MTRFSIRIGEEAASDILDQFSWYEAKSGSDLAGRWERPLVQLFYVLFAILIPERRATSNLANSGARGA